MTSPDCVGCLGNGRCWVCLGTGYGCPETRTGLCQRCVGARRCDQCDNPFLLTQIDLTGEQPTCTSRRVLVIDDEESMRTLLQLWFRDDARCLSVVAVPSVEAAFVALALDELDAIVSDLHIGALTSDRYLPGLRAAAPAARIVIFTCDPELAEELDVITLGADAVVDKTSAPLDQLVELALRAPAAA
jgi:CheY-like chemotaxis protein